MSLRESIHNDNDVSVSSSDSKKVFHFEIFIPSVLKWSALPLCIEIRPFIVVIYFNCFSFLLLVFARDCRWAEPSNLRNREIYWKQYWEQINFLAFYISYRKPTPIFVYDRLQNTTKRKPESTHHLVLSRLLIAHLYRITYIIVIIIMFLSSHRIH